MTTDTQKQPPSAQIPDHGVPPEAVEAESKGLPSSSREKSETAVAKTGRSDA
jgi:hypothetical protein